VGRSSCRHVYRGWTGTRPCRRRGCHREQSPAAARLSCDEAELGTVLTAVTGSHAEQEYPNNKQVKGTSFFEFVVALQI